MQLSQLKGVGDATLAKLNKLGINTLSDLIEFFPSSYLDMTKVIDINEAVEGEHAVIRIYIEKVIPVRYIRKGMNIVKAKGHSSGEKVELTWFNMPYIASSLSEGDYYVWGRVDTFGNSYSVINPSIEKVEENRYLQGYSAVYPLKGEIGQKTFKKILREAIDSYIPDTPFIDRLKLKDAAYKVHFPKDAKQMRQGQYQYALNAVAEDLVVYRLSRKSMRIGKFIYLPADISDAIQRLPFCLSDSQYMALEEIKSDLESAQPMNRILLGDVGCGKTVVALLSMLSVALSGGQTVLMCPTEILCNQHYLKALEIFSNYDLKVDKLCASMGASERNRVVKGLESGEIHVLVATHSCLSNNVNFANLKYAVIDELHKFGVEQKGILENKNNGVDVLVMSATPVPRSMAMIIYGDLQLSLLDKRAANKDNVTTYLFTGAKYEGMLGYLRKKVESGEQCYLVCPRLENADGEEMYSAKGMYKTLIDRGFDKNTTALIYGKLAPDKKAKVMRDFAQGKTKLLVATTVVEVGIDVPQANTMVIMCADSLGLASLHQLRGRIGRDGGKAECFLHLRSRTVSERMRIMRECNDGIKLAIEDAKLRGYGDLIGVRQSGKSSYSKYKLKITLGMIKQAKKLADGVDLSDKELLERYKEYIPSAENITLN